MKFSLLLLFTMYSPVFAAGPAGSFHQVWGPKFHRQQPPAPNSKLLLDRVHRWNQIAINATGLDHTPVAPGENRVFGEQLGPCRAARAEAIVHIAIFAVVNSIVGGYQSYVGIPRTKSS